MNQRIVCNKCDRPVRTTYYAQSRTTMIEHLGKRAYVRDTSLVDEEGALQAAIERIHDEADRPFRHDTSQGEVQRPNRALDQADMS